MVIMNNDVRLVFEANTGSSLAGMTQHIQFSIFLNKRSESRGISKSNPSNTFPPVSPGSQLVKRQHWQRPQEIKWRPVCANVMPHGSMQCVCFSSPSLSLCFSLPLWACVCLCLCVLALESRSMIHSRCNVCCVPWLSLSQLATWAAAVHLDVLCPGVCSQGSPGSSYHCFRPH